MIINKLIAFSIPILPKWFIKLFSNPYVAGETIDDVLQHIKTINQKGFSATVDILGEHVLDEETSRIITTNYCELYDKIHQESLDCNLSIKPTHLGLELSLDTALKNMFNDLNKNNYSKKLVVLFSPSSASYDQFSNFVQRGNKFKFLVKKYAKKYL